MHQDKGCRDYIMKEYARGFYTSAAWKKVSALYMTSKNYICERCGGSASICHHKRYITPRNINNPSITLNMDNLECLCQDCHNKEHKLKKSLPVFDDQGNMTGVKESADIEEFRKNLKLLEGLKTDLSD